MTAKDASSTGFAEQRWYFCLRHQDVERGPGCRAADRLGPYPDADTAARALEIARQRAEAEDEADRRFDEET